MKNLITYLVVCVLSGAAFAGTPIVNEDYKLLASDGASSASFGSCVATSEGTIVVGAHYNDDNGDASGSAYVYRFDGKNWIETKLLASDGSSVDDFGSCVAISGDTVVVGARYDDDNGDASGSAYVYRFDGKNWIETKLIASDGASGDNFGYSVAISGDTVVVGAHGDDDNGDYSGSAYIYRFDGKNWIETKLIASDGASDDNFGYSVATSGDTIVVGAHYDDGNGSVSGSAYVYRFDGKNWIETKLIASDGASGDNFGYSVAISGDTVVVGARYDDDNGSSSGSAYVYRFDGNNWIETKLLASDGASYDLFGGSVATSGDTIVVGAHADDDNGSSSGSAYAYHFDGNNWIETKLLASDGAGWDIFGSGVATSGDTVVVGASFDDNGNGSDSGSAYVFYFVDTDGDGVLDDFDNCYLYNPDQADCNENGIGDVCDIADQTSYDCDQNGVPDECQPDCNDNGIPDECENFSDCNDNDIPDECELDCNENSIPDDCDIIFGISEDCNENGVPDECDIADGLEEDCNGNGVPDSCDLAGDPSLDCDGDGIFDSCAINDGLVEDCNGNDIPDSCDLDDGTALDCNGNGVPDSCELDGTAIPEGSVQWTIEEGGNGHWYHMVYADDEEGLHWTAARDAAVQLGGYLASITSESENQFVFNNFISSYDAWSWQGTAGHGPAIGGQRIDVTDMDSDWIWVSGEEWDYSVWASGQPSGEDSAGNLEPYLHFYSTATGIPQFTWNDIRDFYAAAPVVAFVVEWTAGIDCNSNGVLDECDIADGTSNDVNGNGIPDECEVDCNGNGVPDHWDIKKGTSEDCNTNGIPDECDIDDGTSTDWNENDIPDECEVDCNTNGYPDDYDIKMGWSDDVNGDGIPDECQCIADITGDNMVNVEDLLAIIGYWGSSGPLGDVNEDGIVDVSDLLIVVGNWGPCE